MGRTIVLYYNTLLPTWTVFAVDTAQEPQLGCTLSPAVTRLTAII
ncbi:hypothetical protein PCCS19_57510 [Paenibacillus sp. CCS19]|nr:hypothetical protein PCCS19_57510 [Paenibacillus cellulosilyticus]